MHGKICATSRLHSRCATLTCTSAARHRNLNTALTSVSISRKSHVDRTLVLRRAATEKDGVKEDAKPSVPPAPPSDKGPSVAQESSAAENASSSNEPVDGKRLSAEEIAAQLSQLRAAAKEQSSKEGLVEVSICFSLKFCFLSEPHLGWLRFFFRDGLK